MIIRIRNKLDFNLIRKRIKNKEKISLNPNIRKIVILIDLIKRKIKTRIYQKKMIMKSMTSKWKEKQQ
jgi:hypothetical protein